MVVIDILNNNTLKIFSIYIGLIIICAIRFSIYQKSVEDSYDVFDYVAMGLMTPIFVIHKIYKWFTINWEWFCFNWLPNTIYKVIYHLIVKPITWIYTKIDIIYIFLSNFMSKVLNKISYMIDKIIYYTVIVPLTKLIEVFNWIGLIVRNFVIATVKVLKNFVSSVLTWTKDIVLKFITYVKYVWDGIYDHIIYPFYLYVIYYPFYVGLWQNICLRIYNYGSNLIYNFYCIVWNGIELIWTKLYDTCLSIYANMGGDMNDCVLL